MEKSAEKNPEKQVETLVLCVDRDNDLGRKTPFKGPIIGMEQNLMAAQAMGLADPTDTDLNALYAAIRLAKEYKTEVVTLTGARTVGVKSDSRIAEQLEEVLTRFKPKSVIFVSDGADDEQVLPIIQSRVHITSVEQVVVRQSKELEKAYFKVTTFIKEISAEPSLARLIFAIPGIALLLLAIGGTRAVNLILAVVAVYFILRGLQLEEGIFNRLTGFLGSLSLERISTLVYLIAATTALVGMGYAYSDVRKTTVNLDDIKLTLNAICIFILSSPSIDLFLMAAFAAIMARLMDEYIAHRVLNMRRYLILLAFLVLVRTLFDGGAKLWLSSDYRDYNLGDFFFTAFIGLLGFGIWVKFTEYMFFSELEAAHELAKELTGREVHDTKGAVLGKVSKVVLDGSELESISVGKRKFKKQDIVSYEDKVVVQAR
ncbi:Uncharacterised protein [uncultured archaeon]|nr:Uncharacterised protein [uncultured archaeon]